MKSPIAFLMLGSVLPLTAGCAPAALAGGVLLISLLAQDHDKREAAKNAEQQRLAALNQQAENERRAGAEQEQKRVAALQAQQAAETRQRQLAEQQRQIRLAEQQAKQRELTERERTATEDARKLLARIEALLTEGRWSLAELPAILRAVDAAERAVAARNELARLHLCAGLYGYLLEQHEVAAKRWHAAQGLGIRNPRVVAPAVWTPGAVEAFQSTK